MTGVILKEFIRRLRTEGYEPYLDELGAGSVRDGDQRLFVADDGEIHYMHEHRAFAMNVSHIRNEVEEYMTEFLCAEPDKSVFRGGGRVDMRLSEAKRGEFGAS